MSTQSRKRRPGLAKGIEPYDWAVKQLRVAQAHKITRGSKDVVVAVIDLGYNYHPLIVAHGGSILAICRALLGPDTNVHTCCCCLIQISRNGSGWELVRDGTDTSHLSVTEDSLH
jgi:broad specificity phosphatase PhoE